MACKIKRTPKNAEGMVWGRKMNKEQRGWKWRKWGKKEKLNQIKRGRRKTKKIRRGLKALKEIKKYQSGTEMLIRRLDFQRVVKNIVQKVWEDLRLQLTAILALKEAGETFLGGLVRTVQSLCITCKESDHNAKRCSAGEMHKGGYLIWG